MILFLPYGTTTAGAGTPGVDMTGLDVVKRALREIGVLNATEDPSGEDADLGIEGLNLILDTWNAKKQCAFASSLDPYTLTPALNPHTIGPTGTFVVDQRPQEIEGLNLLLTDTARVPINLLKKQEWLGMTVRGLSGPIPTDCWYDPLWPNGALWLDPVPETAYDIEILLRGLLTEMTLTTLLALPPGYRMAVVLTLAEDLVAPMQVAMPDGLPRRARDARALIMGNNTETPNLATRDGGMPGGRGGGFNFYTGEVG